jgi:hypothetical protein
MLHLLKIYNRIYPTFHVSLLKKWHPHNNIKTLDKPQLIDVEGTEEWEVKDILDK